MNFFLFLRCKNKTWMRFSTCVVPFLLLCSYSGDMLADSANLERQLFSFPVSFERTYFGLHIQDPHGTANWPVERFGGLRLWDNYVNWSNLEPRKGEWHFNDLDRLVNKAQESGVGVLLVLGQTPAWASARPKEASPYFPGSAAEPVDIEDWKRYVRTVATRYRGRIQAYEVWNEVDLKAFWTGSFLKLAELEREAYSVLKSVDPNVIVVSANMSMTTKSKLNEYFYAGNGRFADVIGYHFYTPGAQPELNFLKYMVYLKDALTKYGLVKKPIWNTETGWRVPEDDGRFTDNNLGPIWIKLSPDQVAGYVIRSLIIERLVGIERFYWYGWNHNGLGLTSGLGQHIRKAGLGYMAAMRWLIGSTVHTCNVDGDVWSCQLIKGKKKGWVIWSVSKQSKIPNRIFSSVVAMEDYLGNVRKVVNDIPDIGETPVMFFAQSESW